MTIYSDLVYCHIIFFIFTNYLIDSLDQSKGITVFNVIKRRLQIDTQVVELFQSLDIVINAEVLQV